MSSSSSASVSSHSAPRTTDDTFGGATAGEHSDDADETSGRTAGPDDDAPVAPSNNDNRSSDGRDEGATEDSLAVTMGTDDGREEAGATGKREAGLAPPAAVPCDKDEDALGGMRAGGAPGAASPVPAAPSSRSDGDGMDPASASAGRGPRGGEVPSAADSADAGLALAPPTSMDRGDTPGAYRITPSHRAGAGAHRITPYVRAGATRGGCPRAADRLEGEGTRPGDGGDGGDGGGAEADSADAGAALAPPTSMDRRNTPGAYRIIPFRRAGAAGGGCSRALDRMEDEGTRPGDGGDGGGAEEGSDVVHVLHATLVEEEEIPELIHGTPLEPPPPPPPPPLSWWEQTRTRLLLAAFIVLSIGLGLALSPADNAKVAMKQSLAPSALPAKQAPAPPSLPSFPPSVSSLPSSPPSATRIDGLFKESDVFLSFPKVAMHGDTAVVTRSYTDVQFFTITNSSLELIAKIDIDFYPESVAFDGDTAVISSTNIRYSPQSFYENLGPGDVYVYARERNGTWSQATQFRPGDLAQRGRGLLVAIDGDIIVLGVPRLDNIWDRDRRPGYVYVYRRNGTIWKEEAKLTPPGEAGALFSAGSVAVRGTSIAVGDYYSGSGDAGAVFVYSLNPLSNSWNPVGDALVNHDCSWFGLFVIFTGNEELLATCGWNDIGESAVYHYEMQGAGEDHILRQTIGLEKGARSIAVDGNAMVVAEGGDGRSCVIRFFVRKSHVWEEIATIDEPTFDEYFGRQVALSGNNTLIASWENVYLVGDNFHS